MSPARRADLRARIVITSRYQSYQWARVCQYEAAVEGQTRLAFQYKDVATLHRNVIHDLHWVRGGGWAAVAA